VAQKFDFGEDSVDHGGDDFLALGPGGEGGVGNLACSRLSGGSSRDQESSPPANAG
jgi:hypothetical protein